MSAPDEVDGKKAHVGDFPADVQEGRLVVKRHVFCDLNGVDRPERSKLNCRPIAGLSCVNYIPAQGTEFAQIGIVFASMVTLIAGRETIIPAAAPVIIKICLDGIWLRTNPRVMPKEITLGGLPDKVINLCSHFR